MYHHAAFFQLLAAFKDLDGIDEAVHVGETYDAWFPTGRFFVRRGAWAYSGEGEMLTVGETRRPAIVRPARAEVGNLREGDWNAAPELVRALRLDSDHLEVTWWRRPPSRVAFWSFDDLCAVWGEPAAARFSLLDGGAAVAWLDANGSERFRLDAGKLLQAAE